MADVEVIGQQQFVALALALKAQGSAGRGLQRELRAKLKDAARPMEAAVLEHVEQYMPSGYAPTLVESLRIQPSQSLRANGAGLRLSAYAKGRRKRRQVAPLDAGILRHPVYGNRDNWVTQRVRPGFWSDPLADSDAPIRAIRQAIQETIDKLGG